MAVKVVLGRDADVVCETTDGLELGGRVRLRPGFVIELVPGTGALTRSRGIALVWTWRLFAVGSGGPIYRGICRWHRPSGNELPSAGFDPPQSAGGQGAGDWHCS
jgi:hypothetical protein